MEVSRFIKKDHVVKTHEITIIDPETKKCRRITPARPGQLFVLRFEGVYEDGKTNPVEELQINSGSELAGYPI